jgi:hypothetical protein
VGYVVGEVVVVFNFGCFAQVQAIGEGRQEACSFMEFPLDIQHRDWKSLNGRAVNPSVIAALLSEEGTLFRQMFMKCHEIS